MERYKFRGSSGKVNLALSGLPEFTCLPGVGAHHRGAFSISPSVEYLERAEVDRLAVEGGRATGVVLVDGSAIRAGLVVSGLGLPQTVLRLSGRPRTQQTLG